MSKSSDATIYDVAKDAGVSIATVSRLLNTPERVSKKNREKILASIDKLEYVPKADARERARKENGRIGVITPFFTVASFVQRLRGIASALVDTPYELTIYPVDSLARLHGYYAMLPLTHRLDGLIVVSLPINESERRRLEHSEIPAVFIENRVTGFSSIEIDDWHGGKLAAQHFIAKGHTLCAYIGDTVTPDYALRPEDRRFEGYQKHLLENGIPLPEKYIKLPSFPPKDQDTHIDELLGLDNPPTAIFCASDDLATNVLKVARKKNIRIPKDLAVIGFDDLDIAEYLDLTTICQSLDQSGVFAVELLLAQMSDPLRPIQNINLQLELVERGTT
jgi:DNA-binding LacI/PurR family transcriptional regulator